MPLCIALVNIEEGSPFNALQPGVLWIHAGSVEAIGTRKASTDEESDEDRLYNGCDTQE
jgi:hypothetical protein